MKIKELFESLEEKGSLLGAKIGNIIINRDTQNHKWDGDFECIGFGLESLNFAPKEISGDFDCSNNSSLTSLNGCPQKGVFNFYSENCGLDTLEGAPHIIKGIFNCSGNKNLTSFKGISQDGITSIMCVNSGLTSLEGLSNIKSPFKLNIIGNTNLTSLEGLANSNVSILYCQECSLTSLEGAPNILKRLECDDNPIVSLKGIHKIIEEINGIGLFPDSIESNILGLLKIKNLKKIQFANKGILKKDEISEIINKYLPNPSPSQIIDCQNELIDAGFEEYAEL